MPTSSVEGKHWLVPRIYAELPGTVLDIGAGNGTYARLIDRQEGVKLIALEVHKPYVVEYELEDLYDKVIIADARTARLPRADVVILGDVIEHMEPDDAQKVWNKARKAAHRTVLASIPLGTHPQEAVNDNEHERHLSTWTNDSVHALGGVVASWTGSVVGCYAVTPA